ncbi:hypothetical protein GYH30_043068 [Glycine max]|uniref:Uncharacterized protein n=2 Tax=Glycine subgen. Soja TaxID=1462606 RepID=K7MCT7_SOYBN|nr:hypothetical protein GYH30_043068 [Glycine max]RZB65633.1 hypothetical protein D0Y65_041625 [Glycine soja]
MSLTNRDLDVRTFADEENLEHYAKYLNQSLITFGFPASLDLFTNHPMRIELIPLLSDISRLEAKVERLEGQLQVKDKDIATITRTVDAYESKNQELVAENDDLRALLRSMQVEIRNFRKQPGTN